MHLKNKRLGLTGKLTFLDFDIVVSETEIDLTILLDNSDGECIDRQFYSLAELKSFLRDWEDYKPTEPLIKDEMAREIIKKWYNKNKIVGKLCSYGGKDWLGLRGSNSVGIDWKIELRVSYKSSLKDGELYSLTELIGEEE